MRLTRTRRRMDVNVNVDTGWTIITHIRIDTNIDDARRQELSSSEGMILTVMGFGLFWFVVRSFCGCP